MERDSAAAPYKLLCPSFKLVLPLESSCFVISKSPISKVLCGLEGHSDEPSFLIGEKTPSFRNDL